MNPQTFLLVVVFLAFVVGLVMRSIKKRAIVAWLLSSIIVPAYILFCAFLLPYHGGFDYWQIAVIVGAAYGAVAGGIGVGIAALLDWVHQNE